MDSFEINKIIGAALAALLLIVGMRVIMDLGSEDHGAAGGHHKLAGGYELPAPEQPGASAAAANQPSAGVSSTQAPAGGDASGEGASAVVAMIAKADVKAGQKVFKKCKACHSTAKGGPHKVGPNLWNIVGRAKASAPGFKYSSAMAAKGGKWTYQDLAAFLARPKAFVKGTKMSFSGLKKAADLANIIAYMRSLSDSPAPLPQ